MKRMILTPGEKSNVVAEVLLQSYWAINEERISKWIMEQLDFNPDETPDYEKLFEKFLVEFSYNVGYDNPSVGEMLNEQLDHLDHAEYSVTRKIISDFYFTFEALLDNIMTEREEQLVENRESQYEYREVG